MSPDNNNTSSRQGIIAAIVAAGLFGMSAPLAKMLLGEIPSLRLAGLLYLGSGIGLSLIWVIDFIRNHNNKDNTQKEAPLRGKDFLWLSLAILCGGILGPIMLIFGLSGTAGSSASLLLNLEGILTALVAFIFFKEAIGKKVWFSILLMVAGGIVISYTPSATGFTLSTGSLLIVGACLMWALDNNFTRNLSDRDPFSIARIKGLTAGLVSTSLSFIFKEPPSASAPVAGALLLGAFSYGISLVLFIIALRHLGSARTGAYFGLGPFIGAVFAIILLKEPITPTLLITAILMGIGVWLLLGEEHDHEHTHSEMTHEHSHTHDDHHRHEHVGSNEISEPHSHIHTHLTFTHFHPHTPDLHHRHSH